jgi:Nucleotidyl transferase AbiEii toxin, Type IV TA system
VTRRAPAGNVAASVRARLTDQARSRGEDVQLVLLRFAIERLMFRLAQSKYRDRFILKGAMLFSLWAPVPYRSTGDLDLLGEGDPTASRFVKMFREICTAKVPDDGVVFDGDSVTAEQTRPDADYQGVQVEVNATLAGARLRLRVDIGFGDIVTPQAQIIDYPSLLDFPKPRLRAYPPETVVAEKLEAIVTLGMRNSRMKDFLDVLVIAKTFQFQGPILLQAVASTFARRKTMAPVETPVALTAAFSQDPTKQSQWRAFLGRSKIEFAPESLSDVVSFVEVFVAPVLNAARDGAKFNKAWTPGGPWS